jgi:hypothetical protein
MRSAVAWKPCHRQGSHDNADRVAGDSNGIGTGAGQNAAARPRLSKIAPRGAAYAGAVSAWRKPMA